LDLPNGGGTYDECELFVLEGVVVLFIEGGMYDE
jgi:hypothetical protein